MAETGVNTADDLRGRRLDEAIAEYIESLERGAPPERERFLAEHSDIAAELREFLADYHAFAPPAGARAAGAPSLIAPQREASDDGSCFGDYELLEEIARGGMGVVYRARQISLDRIVALKMILSGHLASPAEVARFRAEAHAAATLDHPHIVPVFEVGERDGQHYFSMGYVAGQSLAQRLLDGPLRPREAATVIRDVARAADYAHAKGVIHRDLKPANILFDDDRRVRVTDFGLAALRTADDGPGLTITGQVLGTPHFMSPEQVSGRKAAVGPGADVYALGATLYALLTGRPPFQAASTIDVLKQVVENEPVPPRKLDASLPRDLETITLKCLEKEPARRYASAAAVADDLQCFLDGRAVAAAPPSLVYRLSKFARRNKALVAAAAVVVFALIGGITMLSIGLSRARAESRRANDALAQARQINSFLGDLLTRASPAYFGAYAGQVTIREAVESAAREIEGSFSDQPQVELALRQTIGGVYEALGLRSEAHRHYTRAVELSERLGEQWATRDIDVRCALLRTVSSVEQASALIPQARALADGCQQRLGPEHPLTIAALDALGDVYGVAHQLDEARAVYQKAIAQGDACRRREPNTYWQMIAGYAEALKNAGEWRESNAILEPQLQELHEIPGPDGLNTYVRTLASVGSNYYDLHDFVNAEKFYRQAVDAAEKKGGSNYYNTILFTHWLARALYARKQFDEAEKRERDSYARACRVIGIDNPTTLEMASSLALILDNSGKLAEAEPLFRDVERARRRSLSDRDPLLIYAQLNLAGNLQKQRRLSEALPLLVGAHQRIEGLPANDEMRARLPGDLGLLLCELSRSNEAEPYLRESIRLRHERRMPLTKTARRIYDSLADICEKTGRADEAMSLRAATTSATSSQP